jgi:hypothetical protein
MTTNDLADPTVEEADRRVERAKASLLSRVELLKHKLTDAKRQLDLQAQIVKHPLPAVGIAFALGVAAGLRGTSSTSAAMPHPSSRSLRGAAVSALAAFGLHIVRELALGQLGQVTRRWWAETGSGSTAEASGSRADDLEQFLEH